jgi:acetyl-CoA acetyltransferase
VGAELTHLSKRQGFLGRAAIAGVGYTPLTKGSGQTVLALAAQACRAALDDCGLEAQDVDGIASFSLFNDSVAVQAVATALAIPELSYALDLNLGGQAPCFAVANAAMAVYAGLADVVLVFRALNGRSGIRIGSQRFSAPSTQYRLPIGLTAYAQYMALWARRFMIETGATEEDLAAVVIEQRRFAKDNDRAVRRDLLTVDQYRAARWVVEPYRTVDCTTEVDGACAVVVTSLDVARGLRHPPVIIEGAAWGTGRGAGTDIADLHYWPDWSMNCQAVLADRLWRSSGLRPSDMDLAEIYDCFSSTVLFGLEGLGMVPRGGSGDFVRSGETRKGGTLPTNTNGGLLAEGYLHGMNSLAEATLQLQGRCDARQVDDAGKAVVTSGGLMDGSALVLVRDGA